MNGVTPDGECFDAALRVAKQLASKPPAAVQSTKALMKAGSREQIRAAMAAESVKFVERLQSPEAQAEIAGFLRR